MDTLSRAEGGGGPVDATLTFIEAHLFEPLSVGDIAATCGLSAYHFSRLFTARHGESVMSYVRRRRMEVAADRLAAEPQTKLIDLALDCGFESQEAFTRAFTRIFGAPPGRYRRDARRVEPQRSPAMPIALALEKSIEKRPAFRVAGIADRFDEETKWKIPNLWDRFVPHMGFPGQDGYETYGVCWSPDPRTGSFRYMAGVKLAPGKAPPPALEVVEIPAQTYLVFKQYFDGGTLHPQVAAATKEIWSELLPKSGYTLAGTPDFEFYPADFEPNIAGKWLSYYIPIVV